MKERKIEPIFTDEKKWKFNSCLNTYNESIYSDGYLLAANKLIKGLINNSSDQDYLIYPIIFLYRHHIELILKEIKKECLIYEENKNKNEKKDHKLIDLWEYIKPVANDFFDNEYAGQDKNKLHMDYIEHVINEITMIDDSSTEFRYPRHKNGKKTLKGITHINFLRMANHMTNLSEDLITILSCINEYNRLKLENNY